LAGKLTPKPKKEVRSVILSLFLAGKLKPEPKKDAHLHGSEICNSIIVFGGEAEPETEKEVRSVILSHRFWRGYELEKGSVVCNSIIVFGGEAEPETEKGSEICNSITSFLAGI
jgi:hypothetical protein